MQQYSQTFWNNFVRMMEKYNTITLVWDLGNKEFSKVLSKAIQESGK